MYPCIIVVSLSFIWLLIETDFLTIQLQSLPISIRVDLTIINNILNDILVFYKECGEHVLLMAAGAGLTLAFLSIIITGRCGVEPNKLILYSELGVSIFILLFGISRMIKGIMKHK
jgi:hypothetical protein